MQKKLTILLLFLLVLFGCNNSMEIESKERQLKPNEEESKQTEEKIPIQQEVNNEPLSQLSVHYIDVGQGDATLFQFTDNKEPFTILYDTGDWKGNEVVPYLQKQNINFIDIIMISHPHADHIGQLQKVMDSFEVGEVWMSGNTANTKVFEEAMEAVLNSEATYDEPRAGDVFDIGPLVLSILHPKDLTGKLNEDSLAFRATYGNIHFLFTGDASAKEEKLILQRESQVDATFLQLGHHGSNTSSDRNFIDKVNPMYAIYSAGKGNSYGHPSEEIVQLFHEKNIPLYGTDINGTIVVTTDGMTYDIQLEKEGNITTKKETTERKKPKENVTSDANCIDINTASKDELQQIIHIGEKRAEDLINLRPYTSIDDLTKINGIGPARIADIKNEGKACLEGAN